MVVDEDVDIYNDRVLHWALCYRVDPGSDDLVVFPATRGGILEPQRKGSKDEQAAPTVPAGESLRGGSQGGQREFQPPLGLARHEALAPSGVVRRREVGAVVAAAALAPRPCGRDDEAADEQQALQLERPPEVVRIADPGGAERRLHLGTVLEAAGEGALVANDRHTRHPAAEPLEQFAWAMAAPRTMHRRQTLRLGIERGRGDLR